MGKVAPAFEIRFNGPDSQGIESVPIQPNLDPHERNVPEPFRKRDKIPRNSGNTFEYPINNFNNIPPQKPSSVDVRTSPSTLNKQCTKNNGDSFHGSQLKTLKDVNNSSSSSSNVTDIIPTTKVKSWNSVGPETEKHDRVTPSKIEKDTFMDNDNPDTSTSSTITFDSAIRNIQPTKKRPLSEESGSEKENVIVDVDNTIQTPYLNKDLNGTTEMIVSVNRKNTFKNNRKNKKINTIDYKDDDDNNTIGKGHLSVDGIATPPATPPRSPPMTPMIAQTPPSSGSSSETGPPMTPMTPMTAHTPISNGSISETVNLSTQTSETITNESVHFSSPQPSDDSTLVESTFMETQIQQSRSPRISKSRPIITTFSLELQEQVETESPINDESPRKNIISHDDVIIPTLAKKLKMNGQLPYPNHEALLGISDEPDELDKVNNININNNNIKPRPESGYMDVTDQVENLFEDANDQFEDELQKSTKKRSSIVSYQRRRRKSAPRRPTRRSRPNSRRNSKTYSHVQIQTDDVIITPAIENVPMDDDLKKRDRKSRREEFVFLTKEDEEDIDIEPVTYSESSLVPEQKPVEKNEMSTEITNKLQNDRQNIMVHPVQSNVTPVALKLERTLTKNSMSKKKQKKDKKNKKKKDQDDGYVEKSICCCVIC
ncbi:hypothetical protein F8M41_011683 [Gigaspora margarita]|uniref:Uncharacterized protein n=1 Tax=Gigaspora margarita TaxID=4874 RepID=A0A8H4ATQ4_GIGMA|nr:hypothetical protein F8M41_011683 [Gigaspora margarita]